MKCVTISLTLIASSKLALSLCCCHPRAQYKRTTCKLGQGRRIDASISRGDKMCVHAVKYMKAYKSVVMA